MAIKQATQVDEAPEYYQELERKHLVALWNVQANLLTKEPESRAIPYLTRAFDSRSKPGGPPLCD